MSLGARVWITRLLTVIAALALVLALAAGYVRHTLVNDGQFADRATAALRSPAVRAVVARRVTDELVQRHAGVLLSARPLVEGVVSTAVGARAFGDLFRAGVRDMHRAVFAHDESTVTLTVTDVGTVAAAALDALRPSLAKQVRVTDHVRLFRGGIGSASTVALRLERRTRLLWAALAAIAVLCALGAVLVAPDRRRAVTGLGVSVAVAGVLLVVAWNVGRTLAISQVSGAQDRAAVGAVWGAFLGDLRLEAWVLAGVGAVAAAAAASLIRPAALDVPLRRAARWALVTPRRRWTQVLRAVVLIAVGAVCVLNRQAVIALVFTAFGTYLIYAGAAVLLELAAGTRAREGTASAAARIPGRRTAVAVIAVAVVVAAAVGGLAGSDATSASAPAQAPCDGAVALCDRPLNQVALAATHNSMAAPLPGWFSAEQDAPIPQQLGAGIRGLLIDTHYADKLRNGRLRTDFNGQLSGFGVDGVSEQATQAAMRLRARLGFSGKGARGMYLCHTFCELGGTALSTVLTQIHDFLTANPTQVLVVINQDYVTPRDFVRAVDAAGLGKLAYHGPTSGRWPTLRQMIDSGQRVVFLAENHAGGAPWYRSAYRSITMETPFHFKRTAQLTDPGRVSDSCRPNRGPDRAPLFLVNNWVSTAPLPRQSNAAKVNAYRPLVRRLRTCRRVRRHIPNLVAVDFYRRGDVMGAVATMNGLRSR